MNGALLWRLANQEIFRGYQNVAEWFPKKERALATGILDSGSNIGACVAPIIVSWIMGIWGWQEAFIFTGAIGFIWLVAWRFYYQKPADQKKLSKKEFDYIHSDNLTEEAPEEKANISWAKLFTLKPTWAFIAGKFLLILSGISFVLLPSYFSTFHLDLKKPSLPLVIVYTAATVGAIGGGYYLLAHEKGWLVFKARKMALFVSALCVLRLLYHAIPQTCGW